MKVMIKVTADDIANGKRMDIYNCPVAKAISRRLGQEVFAGTEEYVTVEGNRVYNLPEKARGFIDSFDGCEDVSPFTFRLEIENEV